MLSTTLTWDIQTDKVGCSQSWLHMVLLVSNDSEQPPASYFILLKMRKVIFLSVIIALKMDLTKLSTGVVLPLFAAVKFELVNQIGIQPQATSKKDKQVEQK